MQPAPEQPALLKGVVDPRGDDFGVSRTDVGGGRCWAYRNPSATTGTCAFIGRLPNPEIDADDLRPAAV